MVSAQKYNSFKKWQKTSEATNLIERDRGDL
jgi:hypothetical protein